MATELLSSTWQAQNFFETTLSADCTDSDTDIFLTSVPDFSEGTLVIDPDSVTGREIIYYSSKTTTKVTCPANGRGYDNSTAGAHTSGTKVIMAPIADWFNSLLAFANKNTTYADETTFDHVASGCVWSGDAYGSTRAASMTSGVVYINGIRTTVSAVTSRTFTASKDTYIDVDSSGTLYYTEVSNNAASPSTTTTGSISRTGGTLVCLGIIVTGASNIANVGSVNQGQEDKVLPIASSVAYSVTDSLGILICPRDPQRRLLGYKRITSDFTTTSNSSTQVTGLSCPVIVPTGRKVKITFHSGTIYNDTANNNAWTQIWDGTVGSGTQLNESTVYPTANSQRFNMICEAITTPSSTSKTYNAGLSDPNSGTARLVGASTTPISIRVELL